jgi:hypothetical protein
MPDFSYATESSPTIDLKDPLGGFFLNRRLAVSFGYFDQLPAELQVNIIELALENLLANRIINFTTITFKPGRMKLSPPF